MKRDILTMLRTAGTYVSGQRICDELGVSRTAVWKTINALKEEGYQIESGSNRGYCLTGAPDVLTEAEVGSLRRDLWADAPLVVFGETDSTNIQANLLAEEGAPEGTLVVADVQNSGKGRRGRGWETPSGIGLAMSFVLRPECDPSRASMLTLVAAMAGLRAVQELTGRGMQELPESIPEARGELCGLPEGGETGLPAGIKWPNDIVIRGKKVCGILTEMKLEEGDIRQVVVGMGFNVGHDHFEGELADKATSLYMETGVRYSRAELCCLVMKYFGLYYPEFRKTWDLSFLTEEYNRCLIGKDAEVRILSPAGDWTGTSLGIDRTGVLLVRDASGRTRKVNAGEVSVRGLYGYT